MAIRHTFSSSSARPAWRLAALLALMLAALVLLSAVALANSPPTTPASVTVSRDGVTLTVIWNTPAGATKYHATYSSDGGNSWTAIGDNLTVNGISVGNTDTTKTYIVAVRAGNDHGWSGWRNSAPSVPIPPPATPGDIVVTRTDGSLIVIWEAVENATTYHVTYSSNNGGSWNAPPCGDSCSNNVTISGVDNDKTYIVAVRARNDGGWSGWNQSAASGPYGPQPPATPGPFTVTRADGTITATWNAVANADKYHINYSSDNKNSWQSFDDDYNQTTITRYADNSKTYYVAIRAGKVISNGILWSGWRISEASGPYGPQPPATPSTVTVSRANGTLTASGYGVSGATKYHITYSADGGNNWSAAPCGNNCTGTSITISGVDNAKPYIVAVRAGNSGGWSGWRNSAVSGPSQPPAAPSSITVIRVCDSRFEIAWTPVSGATGYDVNFSTNNRKVWKRTLSNVSKTAWKFNQWSKNKTYHLAVRARNSAGEGGWTNSAAFPPPPCRPDNLRAVTSTTHGTEGGSITTTWDAAKRANAYNVNYRVDGGDWQRIATGQSATTHTGAVSATGNYTVSVQSTNGSAMSQWRNGGVAGWLTASDISASGATLTIADHSGDWYVKETSPTAGTCSASAITGTTHALTTLSAGQTYTYAAYSDSSCATELASATFSTPVADIPTTLTVSGVTGNGATLTIAGHSGDWYYKHTTPASGTCSAAVSGSTATLTGLNANTEYIFKSYSDSACANEVAAADSFYTGETVSNLTTTGDVALGVGQTSTSNVKRAAGFRTGSRSRGYTLKSVTVHMPVLWGVPTSFTVAIHADSGGNPAASATHTLSGTKPNSSGNHTFTCSGACALNADTDYFLVLSGAGANYNYFFVTLTTSGVETVTPANAGWSIANQGKQQTDGGSWTNDTNNNNSPVVLAFELRASVNTALGAGSLTYTTQRRQRH